MKFRCVFLAEILTAVLSISGNILAYTGDGDGSAENPYQIANVTDFEQLSATPTDWSKSFILTADIVFDPSNPDHIFTQPPIASNTTFTGVFDGQGYVISNLTIMAAGNNVGLFGSVGSIGQIRNLGIEDVDVYGHSFVGGLVGYNSGTLTSCYAAGSVSGTSSLIGGLVGENRGLLAFCYATGSANGAAFVGGLVGENSGGTVTSCYATGSVSGTNSWFGGLVGENRGTLNSCYATGSVTGTEGPVGGLVGSNQGSLTSCFWDIQTSGQRHNGHSFGRNNEVTGKMTIRMKTLLTFTNAGWADKGWVINDGLDYPRLAWENTEGVPIPQPQDIPLIGSGMADDPYLISTAEEFALLSWYPDVLDKQIKLTENLDLSEVTIYPIIGNYDFPFMGVFDGNDHIISNAVINQPSSSYVGLFGGVGMGGQIRNLGVKNVNITGLNCVVGGLVGRSSGTLTSCYVTGSVTGADHYVGGLVAWNSGTLSSCYATASVTGTGGQYSPVGGLVGYNNGTLTSCYATGSVTGIESRVGGLVGDNQSGTLTSCYATGSVYSAEEAGGLVGYNDSALITACFWDMETSGQSNSVGGIGKKTAEMKILATFTAADWDFINVWNIGENQTYPYLRTHPASDINKDRVVNLIDLSIMAEQWMEDRQ